MVHGVRTGRALGAPRFRCDELRVERIGEPGDNLVLHIEKVSYRLVEPFRPKVIAGFGIDQLNVDAHAIAAALH
jgi:hypothetical protein